MTYAYRSVGAVATGNGALNPGAPAGKAVGDLLLLSLVGRNNAETAPAPTGWTLVSPTSPVSWNYLYARIADGTADDTPTGLLYSGTTRSQAQIAAFSGGGYPLATIVANSVSQYLPGTQTSILYSNGLTIAPAACLVIAVGTKNKTATSNGTTINNLTGFTEIDSNVINGTDISQWWGYQIQTTPTDIAASLSQTLTGTTETLQYTSLLVALQSAPDIPAATGIYSMAGQDVTFSTSFTGSATLLAAAGNYNYSLAHSSSDFELTAASGTYAYFGSDAFLVRLPQDTFFAVDAGIYSIGAQNAQLTVFIPTPPAPGTFPNVIGLPLQQAQQVLQDAGAVVPASIGYFGTWPITITWVQDGTTATGTLMQGGLVIAQTPHEGSVIVANAPIVLTVTEIPVAVATPPSEANF